MLFGELRDVRAPRESLAVSALLSECDGAECVHFHLNNYVDADTGTWMRHVMGIYYTIYIYLCAC